MGISLFPKKISTSTMGLSATALTDAALSAEGYVPVLRVWGVVSGRTPGVSQFGNYIKFNGELGALNILTNEEARSQACVLPTQAETIVNSIFEKATKDGGVAQIAVEIGVTENKSGKAGAKYMYVVKPLIEYKAEDALSQMAKDFPAVPKALKAPKK